jgi:hypothetical protein
MFSPDVSATTTNPGTRNAASMVQSRSAALTGATNNVRDRTPSCPPPLARACKLGQTRRPIHTTHPAPTAPTPPDILSPVDRIDAPTRCTKINNGGTQRCERPPSASPT